jgi:hypothetical protein
MKLSFRSCQTEMLDLYNKGIVSTTHGPDSAVCRCNVCTQAAQIERAGAKLAPKDDLRNQPSQSKLGRLVPRMPLSLTVATGSV